ncbi:hypothetical protein DMC30DRAFT_68663 [Rhodotorula diobovata]|uniref:Uncharacterized protein n=1 Tax=Rhodotorula diobovata TaxID=5288 RepID=A0A5C5G1Z6_9BASI|nr:hypothetical protein DMC30DRAFT_68663 [Rhodotorula diobovata]
MTCIQSFLTCLRRRRSESEATWLHRFIWPSRRCPSCTPPPPTPLPTSPRHGLRSAPALPTTRAQVTRRAFPPLLHSPRSVNMSLSRSLAALPWPTELRLSPPAPLRHAVVQRERLGLLVRRREQCRAGRELGVGAASGGRGRRRAVAACARRRRRRQGRRATACASGDAAEEGARAQTRGARAGRDRLAGAERGPAAAAETVRQALACSSPL